MKIEELGKYFRCRVCDRGSIYFLNRKFSIMGFDDGIIEDSSRIPTFE